MINHHRVVRDLGYWPLDGLESMVPKDDPHYFDDKVVGELVIDLEKNLDQFASKYCDRKSFQVRIDIVKKRWEN